MGTMQELRDLLAGGGITVAEVIELGYAPSSVYKAAQQVNGREGGQRRRPLRAATAQTGHSRTVTGSALRAEGDDREELLEEIARLREEAEGAEELRADLQEAHERLRHVEGEAQRVPALQAKMALLETEARGIPELRERVKDLEGQLQRATNGQAEMRQSAIQWQHKVQAEQANRQKAESQTISARQDNQRLHGELEQWRQWGANAQSAIQTLTAEVEDLRPLKVWAGHPCKVCKRPLPGVVSREDAAKAMVNFGHTDCLKDEGPGLGWLLAGGAGLYALSQMQKRA